MAQNQSFAIEDYIHIIWYRKWLLIIPVVTMVLVTGVGSLFLPDIYRAYTLILVENQQIPEQYVNLQRFDMEKSMATIRQQIMSRSLLERVIAEYNLYPELIENRVPMEEILDIMRDSIQLKVEGKEGFTLFFQGADPYIVMQVTNKISSLFIEATTESRTKTAEDTVEFLERNKEELRVQLEAQEKALREFKTAHIGELPDQAEGIFSIIAGL
ncbi:hypothetical protein KDL45_01225, partial [bacterium]|nr:hypothetical protein [bacterium]